MLQELLADLAVFWADVQGSIAVPAPAAGTVDRLIQVDPLTGGVANASLPERCGIALLTIGAIMSRPLGNVGFSHGARLVGRVFRSDKAVRLVLAEDATFEMPYADGYWSLLLPRRSEYEADVEVAMLALAGVDFAFVDCGANYGYWSILITSAKFGRHPAVAIEAAPDTFEWLARNAASNGNRFDILHRAVAERSGTTVTIRGTKHEARSIASAAGQPVVGEVETLALDDLLGHPGIRDARHIVLKLDVEGVELDALRGATQMLEREVLIAYEDHGSDPKHEVSASMLADRAMRVFRVDRRGATEIVGLDQLDTIKRNRHRGYDFFATRSPFWASKLEAMVRVR